MVIMHCEVVIKKYYIISKLIILNAYCNETEINHEHIRSVKTNYIKNLGVKTDRLGEDG